MPVVVYIHGFLSSPLSTKAQMTGAWLAQQRPEWRFECPALSSYPAQAAASLEQLVERYAGQELYLIGSSMGGFWATFLAEKYGLKAVLVNPAVLPQDRFQNYVGVELHHYYSDEVTVLTEKDLADLASFDVSVLSDPRCYWLMVQTGDETLDYRLAVQKYQGCRQLVEEGGSHTFDGFARWLPAVADFFEH